MAIMATALLLSGCHGWASAGTLTYQGDDGEWCLPSGLYPVVSFAAPVDIDGEEPIMITDVAPVDAVGLEMTDAYLVPVTSELRAGAAGVPLEGELAEAWDQRAPIDTAQISPGEIVDLVVLVDYLGPGDASFSALTIDYQQAGQSFSTEYPSSLVIAEGSCS